MMKNWKNPEFRWLAAAIVFAIVVLFFNLGSSGMYAPQEGRTAIIVRNMLLSGNCMDMDVPGGIPYEKPIGHYWLCLPTAHLFGLEADPMQTAAEWALRLPSAFMALLALAAAAILAARIYTLRTAAFTIIILSSMLTFVRLGRLAHIDMPLAGAFAATMLFLFVGYFEKMKANNCLYGFYAFLGIGMLLKGPLVILLAGLVVLAMMIYTRRWKMVWELRPISGAAVFLAVTLPWYWAETVRSSGAFFEEFIMNQNVRRFTGIGSGYRDGERMALYYYFPKMFAGALPWSLISVAALALYFRKIVTLKVRRETVFLLMWLVTGFVFFTLSALKRGDYLLPLYPALGILTARAAEIGCERLPALSRRWRWGWGVLAALLLAVLGLNLTGIPSRIANYALTHEIKHVAERDAQTMLQLCDWFNAHILLTCLGIAAILAILFHLGSLMEKRRYFATFGGVAAVVLLIEGAFYGWIEPATDRYKTVKEFIPQARKLIPEGQTIAYYGDFNTELVFFMNRPYTVGLSEESDCLITSNRGEKKLRRTQPGVWRPVLRTIENHQYPAILMFRE